MINKCAASTKRLLIAAIFELPPKTSKYRSHLLAGDRAIGTVIWKPGLNFLSLPPPPLIRFDAQTEDLRSKRQQSIFRKALHRPDQLLVGNPEFLPTDNAFSFQAQFVQPAQHKVRGSHGVGVL